MIKAQEVQLSARKQKAELNEKNMKNKQDIAIKKAYQAEIERKLK